METQLPGTPWHKESYDRLLDQTLPELLASRLPLAEYRIEPDDPNAYRVQIALSNDNGEIDSTYQIPQPDERGVFMIGDHPILVVPYVMDDDLATADVLCVGERLHDYIDSRLGEAPENLPWDADLLKAWLPLEQWFADFFERHAQRLDQTNWLATQRHLRAIILPNRDKLITPGHFGRACPFETPEGPNIGRVLRVAVGAAIQYGRIIILDESPQASLGMSASMIPLLEHDDPNRILMGTNMMGQWLIPPDPEPALVQTGNEPNAPNFWCGRNLLTAFVSWGGDTIEDGIVISQSAAAKLNYPHIAEPGDKISDRHGIKGVISRILSDDLMPHLPDGTPVELIYSFMGIPGRLNFGPIREAIWGRIARTEGTPVIIPPFETPSEDELRRRMADAGLPECGMEVLTHGENGEPLSHPSTVGWVYWGKTVHTARSKLMGGRDAPPSQARKEGLQRQAELEYRALRDAAAFEYILEIFNTLAAREGSNALTSQVVAGTLQQSSAPSPRFAALRERLAAAGIETTFENEALAFGFAPPQGESLSLSKPVRHPWLWERELTEIGIADKLPEYAQLAEANSRLARILDSKAPDSLIENAYAQLQTCVDEFFAALLSRKELRFDARVQFSGRALLAPGPELSLDQIGLAEELAWRLFSPHVIRELGDDSAVQNRTPEATQVLDEIMTRSWVIINRAPSLTETAILAFHPVRIPDKVIRINPLVCAWLNADFDGDQVAVFLPLTSAGQQEAGECLSVVGHLSRDVDLVHSLVPTKAAIWGLAKLSLTQIGKAEINEYVDVPMPDGYLTQTTLEEAVFRLLEEQGPEAATRSLEWLAQRGFEVARKSGASISPFLGESLWRPPIPEGNNPEEWNVYADQITDHIASRNDFDDPEMGVHLLTIKSRKQMPSPRVYTLLCATRGVVTGMNGQAVVVSGNARTGLTPQEMYNCVVGAREGLARIVQQWEQPEHYALTSSGAQSFNVLARARQAQRPGIVFARAAAIQEIDPLVDLDSRLFVGLKPK